MRDREEERISPFVSPVPFSTTFPKIGNCGKPRPRSPPIGSTSNIPQAMPRFDWLQTLPIKSNSTADSTALFCIALVKADFKLEEESRLYAR